MWLGRGGPASAAGLSRRVRMLPTVPDLPCLRRRLQRYQIGERYYPDWAPILVHHRQAGSPQLGHPFRDIGDALVSKAIKHVTAQRLTYSDLLRIATLCDNPGRNIAAPRLNRIFGRLLDGLDRNGQGRRSRAGASGAS